MEYKTLGNTGLLVSRLCLGTMTFGGGEGPFKFIGAVDQKRADELIKVASEDGINFFDTADAYGDGASEKSSERSSPTAVTRSSSARRSSTRPVRTSMREACRADTSSAGSRPA